MVPVSGWPGCQSQKRSISIHGEAMQVQFGLQLMLLNDLFTTMGLFRFEWLVVKKHASFFGKRPRL